MWSQIISSTLFSRCSIWIKYQPNPGYGNPPEELDFAYWTSVQCSTAVLPIAKQSQCSKFSISAGLLPSMSHEGGLRWVRSVHMSSQPGFRHHDLTWEGSTWRTLLGQLVHFPRLQCLWSMEDEEARLDSAVLLRTWSVNVLLQCLTREFHDVVSKLTCGQYAISHFIVLLFPPHFTNTTQLIKTPTHPKYWHLDFTPLSLPVTGMGTLMGWVISQQGKVFVLYYILCTPSAFTIVIMIVSCLVYPGATVIGD